MGYGRALGGVQVRAAGGAEVLRKLEAAVGKLQEGGMGVPMCRRRPAGSPHTLL